MKSNIDHKDSAFQAIARHNAMQIMQSLRTKIESGTLPRGNYLPAVRKLSKVHGVAANTMIRALRMMMDQGLLESHPRRGYWICENKPETASFAYLMSTENIYAGFDALYKTLMHEFQACAHGRSERFTTIVLQPENEEHIIKQHGLSQLSGVVLDTPSEALLEWSRKSGVRAVLIDDEDPQRRVNSVVQNNFAGGELAAEHLLSNGCKRIAWFGRALEHHHPRARYGGAVAALATAQRKFIAEHFVSLDDRKNSPQMEQVARAMLEQRPDGVLALWRPMVAAIVAVARQMGLKIGVDFQCVGWSCNELYESSYAPLFDGPPPPAIVWSAQRMAETAMDLLRSNSEVKAGASTVTLVPVSLRKQAAR